MGKKRGLDKNIPLVIGCPVDPRNSIIVYSEYYIKALRDIFGVDIKDIKDIERFCEENLFCVIIKPKNSYKKK